VARYPKRKARRSSLIFAAIRVLATSIDLNVLKFYEDTKKLNVTKPTMFTALLGDTKTWPTSQLKIIKAWESIFGVMSEEQAILIIKNRSRMAQMLNLGGCYNCHRFWNGVCTNPIVDNALQLNICPSPDFMVPPSMWVALHAYNKILPKMGGNDENSN
jgi:hypothetical protein